MSTTDGQLWTARVRTAATRPLPPDHSTGDTELSNALQRVNSASDDQRSAWASANSDALGNVPDNDPAHVATGDYGPVRLLANRLLYLARSGGLDGQLLSRGLLPDRLCQAAAGVPPDLAQALPRAQRSP